MAGMGTCEKCGSGNGSKEKGSCGTGPVKFSSRRSEPY